MLLVLGPHHAMIFSWPQLDMQTPGSPYQQMASIFKTFRHFRKFPGKSIATFFVSLSRVFEIMNILEQSLGNIYMVWSLFDDGSVTCYKTDNEELPPNCKQQ